MDSSKLKLASEWIVKILGPFLLLPLATLPLDIGTSIFWLAGFIFFLIALTTAIKSIILGPTIKNLINPILVMSIVALSMYSISYSYKLAKEYAYTQAMIAQAMCKANSRCPKVLAGWRKRDDAFSCDANYGALVLYSVRYRTLENNTKFEIHVRQNIDYSYIISGGINQTIQY